MMAQSLAGRRDGRSDRLGSGRAMAGVMTRWPLALASAGVDRPDQAVRSSYIAIVPAGVGWLPSLAQVVHVASEQSLARPPERQREAVRAMAARSAALDPIEPNSASGSRKLGV